MKRIISALMGALLLTASLFVLPVFGADLCEVSFDSVRKIFFVSGGADLVGTNRVLLMVKDDEDNLVYVDAQNDVQRANVYFEVNLGSKLKKGSYTFILSSDGDTVAEEVSTCYSEVKAEADFFNVSYNRAAHKFEVTGEVSGCNRILLMVYAPQINSLSDLYYMDALNSHTGEFSFDVFLPLAAPGGEYTFIVSTDGDTVTEGYRVCSFLDNFITFGTLSSGMEFGATYTLEEEQADSGAMVMVALYWKNTDGTRSLVRTNMSSAIVTEGEVKSVTAKLTLTEEEIQNINNYCAQAFVWNNSTELRPQKASRGIQER